MDIKANIPPRRAAFHQPADTSAVRGRWLRFKLPRAPFVCERPIVEGQEDGVQARRPPEMRGGDSEIQLLSLTAEGGPGEELDQAPLRTSRGARKETLRPLLEDVESDCKSV